MAQRRRFWVSIALAETLYLSGRKVAGHCWGYRVDMMSQRRFVWHLLLINVVPRLDSATKPP